MAYFFLEIAFNHDYALAFSNNTVVWDLIRSCKYFSTNCICSSFSSFVLNGWFSSKWRVFSKIVLSANFNVAGSSTRIVVPSLNSCDPASGSIYSRDAIFSNSSAFFSWTSSNVSCLFLLMSSSLCALNSGFGLVNSWANSVLEGPTFPPMNV